MVKNLNNQMKAIEKRLDKQISVMTPLMNSDNVTLVNNETVVLDQIYSEVTDINARICTTLRGEDEECEESVTAEIAMDKMATLVYNYVCMLEAKGVMDLEDLGDPESLQNLDLEDLKQITGVK